MTTTRSPSLSGLALAILALAAFGGLSRDACEGQSAREGQMPVRVTAEMTSPTFVVGEMIQVRLTLENVGPDPVDVADPLLHELDPEYVLSGPGTEERVLNLGAARTKTPLTDPMSPPVVETILLEAGATWSELIPLNPMVELTDPGSYRLRVELEVGGERARAAPVGFELLAPDVTAFSAVPTSASEDARVFAAWSHREENGAKVVEEVRLAGIWQDDRRGKLYTTSLGPSETAGVSEVEVPVTRSERGMDFRSWVAWSEAGAVFAQPTNGGHSDGDAVLVHRGGGRMILVPAPLMDEERDLRLFLVSWEGPRASLLRVDVSRGRAAQPGVAFDVALPLEPIDARALHLRVGASDLTHLFVLGRADGETALALVTDGGEPSAEVVARFGPNPPAPGASFAAGQARGGQILAAYASVANGGPPSLSLLTAVIEPDGARPAAVRALDVPLDEGITAIRSVSLAVSERGLHVLLGADSDQWWYGLGGGGLQRVEAHFRDDPAPRLLLLGGRVLAAGARDAAGFGLLDLGR